MKVSGLRCVACERIVQPKAQYSCPACGNILKVLYEKDAYGRALDVPLSESFALMPVDRDDMAGIGTTPTPLLRAKRLGEQLGLTRLYFKCEQANLSGSFKDRPVAVAVAMAKKLGYTQVVAASSGNAAAATAACAARYGLESIILVPASTPAEKVAQTAFYGAKLFKVEGPYSECYRIACELSQQHGIYNVTTTFLNPYAIEGDKMVGYELFEALGELPDAVYVPVGAGPLLVGTGRGLEEYKARHGMDKTTRLIAVQAQGNSPIAKAFTSESPVQCEPFPNTIAGGIADGLVGYEQDGEYTLRWCRETKGAVRAVDDDEISHAQRMLADREGIFVEPSAAASLAAIIRDLAQGRLRSDELIVALLTGHGLKDMKAIGGEISAPVSTCVSDIAKKLYSK